MDETFMHRLMTAFRVRWRVMSSVFSRRGALCAAGIAVVAILCVFTQNAMAEEIPTSLAELIEASKVKEGDRIEVVDSGGRRVTGRIVSVSRAALEVARRDGVLQLGERDIRTMVKHDSVENGVWLGVAAGLGAWFAYCAREDVGDCFGYIHSAGLMFTAPAALLGWAIDSSMNETVYMAHNGARVNVRPVVAARNFGGQISIRW